MPCNSAVWTLPFSKPLRLKQVTPRAWQLLLRSGISAASASTTSAGKSPSRTRWGTAPPKRTRFADFAASRRCPRARRRAAASSRSARCLREQPRPSKKHASRDEVDDRESERYLCERRTTIGVSWPCSRGQSSAAACQAGLQTS